MTISYQRHRDNDPVPHRFIATGMGKVTCAVCQLPADSKFHHAGMRDEIGADVTTCPGCEDIWPIELTVRMMRFVHPVTGKETVGRNLRVCQPCAKMPVDEWALLALRYDRGFMTEERYLTQVQELATKAAESPTPTASCGAAIWIWGTQPCNKELGHSGGHRHIVVRQQNRKP